MIEEIQGIMSGHHTIINVTNPITKRWIADAQFDRNDTKDNLFGEVGFQKTMKRIQKKKSFLERLFFAERKYEIYDLLPRTKMEKIDFMSLTDSIPE